MKYYFYFIIALCATSSLLAQEPGDKNYLFTNYSYSFFGTGDISGDAIGINYHRMFSSRIGANIGYSKATGIGHGLTDENVTFTNVFIQGGGDPAFSIGIYHTLMVGLTYGATAGDRSALLINAGFAYKSLTYNHRGTVRFDRVGGDQFEATVLDYNYLNENELGYQFGLDYLQMITSDISLGLHLSIEQSDNIVSKAGLSVGVRF